MSRTTMESKPPSRRRTASAKPKLDSVLNDLRSRGWEPGLTEPSYLKIIDAGFHRASLPLVFVATEIALQEQPITLRGLFYRVVSAGWLPSTEQKHYSRLGRLLTSLREAGIIPFSWIVDNLRETHKPSSWSGIGDFVETVRDAYRMDFWARLPEYVHVFCEKDAIAGTLLPVTSEFDVALSPVRGYCSLSFAHEIAELWGQINKPIHAYYLGDFDPAGFDIERDLKQKLRRYTGETAADLLSELVGEFFVDGLDLFAGKVRWTRLGVNETDFDEFDLHRLPVKKHDRRGPAFIEQHGEDCAELDALPATELRRRVQEAIEEHIPREEWERLQRIEETERESFNHVLEQIREGGR